MDFYGFLPVKTLGIPTFAGHVYHQILCQLSKN